MNKKQYRCGAKPLGNSGPTCKAPPSEHRINKATTVTRNPMGQVLYEMPQHEFVVGEESAA